MEERKARERKGEGEGDEERGRIKEQCSKILAHIPTVFSSLADSGSVISGLVNMARISRIDA